ncbi:protein-glutamate O-methyltransferase CheR [candidate division KSB3 bacterium]|uniref:protein-glutamate O-methyltransferase n=1 Tax=candidate division KSB3 bacterium TaxID=2044937 RepID=A0A9D5JVM5_9BACT|nr:protein-glutamate O-methyltransferase CheR [candidate division KSB3 bacterium]MBD3324979.1 protein-glutamate O-methyltransferase CheR [candidate division KSB3 bacterium]
MVSHDTQHFAVLRDRVLEKSGLFFDETKRQYFLRRVQQRMQVVGCPGMTDYTHIIQEDTSEAELSELLNLLTTTETYFFRNRPQLQAFEEEIIPAILQRKQQAGESQIQIWSAGCSSGEEPYTIAMLLLERIPALAQWDITILGTDINTQVLAHARVGRYPPRAFRDMPAHYQTKYFTPDGDQLRIAERVQRLVTFRQENLLTSEHAPTRRPVDCIFCRNLLIYFHRDAQNHAVNILYGRLAPQGYLFVGHAESLYRMSARFTAVKLQHSWVYYKA